MGRIMVSLLLTVCACVFTILEAKPQYGDWWANNRAPCTEPPCPPECPWPEDCRRNRGPQYGGWWANNRGPSHQYGHYGSFLGMGRPQYPQFGARPQYRPQLPQYGNYGGLWGQGNKAARPPRWWGQG